MEQIHIWNLIAKKLSGEAEDHELLELEQVLRANPELHYSMQTIIDLWRPEQHFDQEEAHRAFERHVARMHQLNIPIFAEPDVQESVIYPGSEEPGRSRRSRKRFLFSALSLAMVAGIILVGFRYFRAEPVRQPALAAEKAISEVSTQNGSKTSLVLPDGTLVWLNSGSKLSYDKNFGNTLREVVLNGEAFFDVVHNAEKPFIIHTNKINIKVLGTKFNVRSYLSDKTTEASLIRGSIEVSFKDRPSEKIILKPNEKIVVANDDLTLKPVSPRKLQKHVSEPIVAVKNLTYESRSGAIIETSWVENRLIFQDESFEDLARRMERWYAVTISFSNPDMKELYFTGNFRNESISQALEALKLTANFNYTIVGNSITISK